MPRFIPTRSHRCAPCTKVFRSIAAPLLPPPLAVDARGYILPANERVTDGARTRDLRSHNPMLYLLSYGHHAQGDSTSARARGKRVMGIALVQSPQPRNSVFLSWRLASSTMRKSLDGLGVLMITTLPWAS